MTITAAHALMNVNAVIEINVVGEIVDAGPVERYPRAVTFANRLQHFCIRPNLRVTVHARLGGRHAGKTRIFDRGVTIPAVNSKRSHMMLVAERHRLRANYFTLRVVTGALHHFEKPKQADDEENTANQSEPGHGVRTRIENLSHG